MKNIEDATKINLVANKILNLFKDEKLNEDEIKSTLKVIGAALELPEDGKIDYIQIPTMPKYQEQPILPQNPYPTWVSPHTVPNIVPSPQYPPFPKIGDDPTRHIEITCQENTGTSTSPIM